jgi:hypothetical protein
MSGCAEIAGSCGPIIVSMSGTMKPLGVGLAGVIMIVCTVARLRHLSISPIWGAAAMRWLRRQEYV